MAFPTIQTADTQSGIQATASTSWTLTYPTNIAAGDLLIAVIATDGGPAGMTFPAEWVSQIAFDLGISKKKALGTESGNFTVTLPVAEAGAWRIYRITDWFGVLGTTVNGPQGGSTGSVFASSLDPPNLSTEPLWGTSDVLWIAAVNLDASAAVSTYPLASTQSEDSSGGADGVTLGLCSTQSAASSFNPDAYTSAGSATRSFTLAIRGTTTKPAFVQASTGDNDAGGAWTATCHAPLAAGRVIIAQIFQDGTTNAALTFTSATNIENLAGTDNAWTQIPGPLANGSWAVGGSEEALQFLFIGRSLSTSAPTMGGGNSTSEDLYWRFYEFAAVNEGTTLADVIENSTAGVAANGAGTSGTIADTAVTTLGADRLALNFVAGNDDNAIDAFAGMTGGTWVEVDPEYAESFGTDGVLQLQAAIMASAGTIDGGSDAWADATDSWGVVGFALIGTTVEGQLPEGFDKIFIVEQAVNRSSVW